jgi:hypothetical protein
VFTLNVYHYLKSRWYGDIDILLQEGIC